MAQMREVSTAPDRVQLRDAALHRISLARRWTIAAAAGLTAGLAALVSVLLPGKSLGAKSTLKVPTAAKTNTPASPATPTLPAPASASQLGVGSSAGQSQPSISPPSSAPQASPSQSAPAQSAAAPSAPAQSAPAPSAPAPAPVSGGS